jgi:hypothetical protein
MPAGAKGALKTGFLFNNCGVVVGFDPLRAPLLGSEELRIHTYDVH